MSNTIFKLENVCFSYSKNKPILSIPSFELNAGERVFLHGPSGTGKSTLLGIIAGIINAEQGVVQVFNHDFIKAPSSLKDKIRGEKIGYIFQMFNLVPYLNVIENILLPCELNKNRMKKFLNKKELLSNALNICEKFEINSILNHKASNISIGQQQRVAAARALLGSPELIIADEPTSALDEHLQEVFLKNLLLQCEKQNTALLFVSHDKRLANYFPKEISLSKINGASK